jgi:hypothetical protein
MSVGFPALLLATGGLCWSRSDEGAVSWRADVESARSEAAAAGKMLFVLFR